MAAISRTLIIVSVLIAVTLSERCKVAVPFTTELVGKTFCKHDLCIKPSFQSCITIRAKRFVYEPTYLLRGVSSTCGERFVFHIRRGRVPFVLRFPDLVYRKGLSGNSSSADLEKFCEKEHPKVREQYFPVGKTRKKFKRAVRRIVKGVKEIRDYGCFKNDDGFIVQVPGRAFDHADVDGIITYLLGVAYQYNFCAEPK